MLGSAAISSTRKLGDAQCGEGRWGNTRGHGGSGFDATTLARGSSPTAKVSDGHLRHGHRAGTIRVGSTAGL